MWVVQGASWFNVPRLYKTLERLPQNFNGLMSKKCVFEGFSLFVATELISQRYNVSKSVRRKCVKRAVFSFSYCTALFTCIMPDLVREVEVLGSKFCPVCVQGWIWGKQKSYIRLDLCHLPPLTFWGNKIKAPNASPGILAINYKTPPCLIWKTVPCLIASTEYLLYFIEKFKIKWLPASCLIKVFSDTDLMSQFCLPESRNFPGRLHI